MPEPFAFDSIGFLQLLNQLERRFDEVVSHAPPEFRPHRFTHHTTTYLDGVFEQAHGGVP